MNPTQPTILIVEDDDLQYEIYKDALAQYKLVRVKSGSEALGQIPKSAPNVLILDHVLDKGELGLDFLPEFKERDEKQRLRKAERLAPVVDAALARKQRKAPRMPDGYHVPAVMKDMMKALGGGYQEPAEEESHAGHGSAATAQQQDKTQAGARG